MSQLKVCRIRFVNREGPEGVKWELGLAVFALGKWGSSHRDWDLVTGNGKKMGMGFENCKMGFEK